MVTTLRDKGNVCKMLALLRLVGPFKAECGEKFLRLMCIVLDLQRGQPEVEMVQVYDLICDYMADYADMAAKAIEQMEDKQLATSGLNLIETMTELTSLIMTCVPVCIERESDPQAKQRFITLCYRRMLRQSYVKDMLSWVIFASAFNNTDQCKSISDNISNCLVKFLKCCPDEKKLTLQALCSAFLSGMVDAGPEFMTTLFEMYQQSADADALELALSSQEYGSQEVEFESAATERALATAKVEAFINKERVKAENPGRENPTLTFIMTTKGAYVLDSTKTGYPETSNGVVQKWDFEKHLLRLVKGHVSQALMLGFLSGQKDRLEDTVILIFHRPKDRDLILGKLQKMKLVCCQDDTLTEKALKTVLNNEPVIMSVYTEPEVSWMSASDKMLLYVLTQASIHKFSVNFEGWLPPSDHDVRVEEKGKDNKLEIEKNAARMQTDAHTAKSWSSAMKDLFRGNDGAPAEVWPLSDLEKVELYPDELPRIYYSFKVQSGFSIRFYDVSSHDIWREIMIGVLQKLDSTSSWSKSAKGVSEPLMKALQN